jgi:hypothetical protein
VRLLFAPLAVLFGAFQRGGGVVRANVQPTGETGAVLEQRGLLRESGKDLLSDILCAGEIAADFASRDREDEVDMSLDEGAERGFGTICNVAAEQSGVIDHGFPITCSGSGKPTENLLKKRRASGDMSIMERNLPGGGG